MELLLPHERNVQGPVSLAKVITQHKGEAITWDASKFIKTKIKFPDAFFAPLNQYISELPGETQDAIFGCYQALYETFGQVGGGIMRTRAIQDGVKRLYTLIDWNHFREWCLFRSIITVPSDVPSSFDQTVHHGVTPEKTYDRTQYKDLGILGLYMKFALPVVALGIAENDVKAGTMLKEQRTFQLFSRSVLPETPPVERMRVYISALTERYTMPASAILGFMGSAELPTFLMARVLIRKMMLSEVDDNIIKMAHHYITQQLDALEKGNGFDGKVKEKQLYSKSGDEDNVSVAENYKVKQAISDGDLETLIYHSRQLEAMVLRVDPSVDMGKLQVCLENLHRRPMVPSELHQKTLTQWILSSSIPPRGMSSLNRVSLMRAMAVAQTLLWHWGFLDLALLMMVERPSQDSMAFTPNNRTNLDRSWHAEFAKRFPHYREPTTKTKDIRHQNVAYMAIEGPNTNNPNMPGLATLILQTEWIPHGPSALVQEMDGVVDEDFWVPPPYIRDRLAQLICHLYDLRYSSR